MGEPPPRLIVEAPYFQVVRTFSLLNSSTENLKIRMSKKAEAF